MVNHIKAIWKRIRSYTKMAWELDDYPLRYRIQKTQEGADLKPWVVQIINWWTMTGLGDSKQEAYQMLKTNFEDYKQNNELPRPGTMVPLRYADCSEIKQLEDVAPDFFENILDINYFDCFISDESSLANFGLDDKETLDKINSTYGLELAELGDGNIVRLLTMIRDKKGGSR